MRRRRNSSSRNDPAAAKMAAISRCCSIIERRTPNRSPAKTYRSGATALDRRGDGGVDVLGRPRQERLHHSRLPTEPPLAPRADVEHVERDRALVVEDHRAAVPDDEHDEAMPAAVEQVARHVTDALEQTGRHGFAVPLEIGAAAGGE